MDPETGGLEALPEAAEQPARTVSWWRMLLALLGAAVILAGVVLGLGWVLGEVGTSELWRAVQALFGG